MVMCTLSQTGIQKEHKREQTHKIAALSGAAEYVLLRKMLNKNGPNKVFKFQFEP